MKPNVAIEFLKALKNAYDTSMAVDAHDKNYKEVWISPNDIRAVECALSALEKLEKIGKLVEYWDNYNSYDTMLGIEGVLKDD